MVAKFKIAIVLVFLVQMVSYGDLLVPIAKKNIKYKQKIFASDVAYVAQSKTIRCQKYIDMNLLQQNKYYAKSFLRKGRAICQRNVMIPQEGVVKFKFGNLEIEKEGRVLHETDQYVKIKNIDGTIIKIYKNGRN